MSQASAEERRRARRARRRETRRRDILISARRVLRRTGLEGFTMSALADEADLSKPSLFYYFDSKEQIMAALAGALLEAESDVLLRAVEGAESGIEALVALLRAHVAHHREDLTSFAMLSTWAQSAGAQRELLERDVYPASAVVNDALAARLVADRELGRLHPDVHPRRLANVAFLVGHGLLQLMASLGAIGGHTRFSSDELLDEACAALRRAALA